MQATSHRHHTTPAHIPVRPEDEIADLVKESEIRTGLPGRCFVIRGAERLTYRVVAHAGGLEIARLDHDGTSADCVYVGAGSFEHHPLAHAQRAGCLYTPSLSREGDPHPRRST